jgi:signal transduction histidine kinase
MLEVRREDELGRLMHAVNRMADDLDEREQRLALEGQQRSHQDKMMAVGALAAGVAHEVNNPLAVIAGSAQALRDEAAHAAPATVAAQAEQILAQAQRAAQAARQLADVAAPQPADVEWFDLAALVRQVLRWTAYDKRWRGHTFDLRAAPNLSAVRGSAAVVQQVLMQLVPLACESTATAAGMAPRVAIEVSIADAATVRLSLVFQGNPDFARDDAQRTLSLVRAALAPAGARLAVAQDEAGGGRITLDLPVDSTATPSPDDAPHPA